MTRSKRCFTFLRVFFAVGAATPAAAWAQAPYYYGTYNQPANANQPAPSAPAAAPLPDPTPAPAPAEPPPVVYRRAPYRRAYQTPEWAYSDAALGPWPWNFDFGGGPTPASGSDHGLTNGSSFEFGGGYNFSPQSGFVLEFMNSWLGVSDAALQRNGAIDGAAHVWSFTVNPIYRFQLGGPIGAYVIGGGGLYQRDMQFDEPVQVFIPTFHGGYYASGIETVRQIDDAGGVNAGAGLTWNMGWGTKFFVEARYHYLFTPGGATQLIPVTFGFRW